MASSKTDEIFVYWKQIYWLIGGSKDCVPIKAIREKLECVKDKLLEGLNYYKQEEKKPEENEKHIKKLNEKEEKEGKKISVLTEILSEFTGLSAEQAKEVLSSYLVNVFCGPAENLKEIVDDENQKMEFVVKLYKFYFEERMFMLKSLNGILTTTEENVLHDICSSLIKELKYDRLYTSLYRQVKTIGLSEPPEFNSSNLSAVSEMQNLWWEHNLYEQIQIMKMLIICASHYMPSVYQICLVGKRIWKTKKKELICGERDKGNSLHLLYMTLIQLQMLHCLQLFDFKNLPDEERWHDKDLFVTMDMVLITFSKYKDLSTLLSALLIVHTLTQVGSKNTKKIDCMGKIAKESDPWSYFNNALNMLALKDDVLVLKSLCATVFELAYLTLSNCGSDYVQSESYYSLIAVLFKDETVLNHFWNLPKDDCLHNLLKDIEIWYPISWKPVLEIYTSIISRGECHYHKIVERMETHLKYTDIQRDNVEFVAVNNSFRISAPLRPLEHFPDVKIPTHTPCTRTPGNPCYVHWDISLPFWSVACNAIRKWLKSQQMNQQSYRSEREQFIIALIKLAIEVLKTAPQDSHNLLCAVEDVIAIMDRIGSNKNVIMVSTCLLLVKEWVHVLPGTVIRNNKDDTIKVLNMLKVLPDIDNVVMNHIQCAQGLFFHTNLIKTLLELVEFKNERYPVLLSYLEFIYTLFMKEETKWTWCTLAGLVFVLNCIFPRYRKWNFADQLERIRIGWLCMHIIHKALNIPESEIYPAKTSVPRECPTKVRENINKYEPEQSTGPTMSLFCNTALHNLLHFDSGTTLLQIVATGEDNLFGMVEKCFTWNSEYCRSIVGTVECALEVLDKTIYYKKFQMKLAKVTPLEEKIYKEPKKNEQYHVIPNLISYINHCMDHKVRYLSIKLLTRFAENVHLPLMMCIEMDPETLREMYLRPLYADVESESIQVAVMEFLAKCIYNQASLAEVFLHAEALEKYITNTEAHSDADPNGGILRPVLEIISTCDAHASLPLYEACVHLIHALWLEKRNMVLSYLRLKRGFFDVFCRPLFKSQMEIIPSHYCVLDVLSYEMFWYRRDIDPSLKKILLKFLKDDIDGGYLASWSVYCTDPHHGAKSGLVPADKHTKDEHALTTAWKGFIVLISKTFADKLLPKQKEVLFVHLVNALWLESLSMLNSDTICVLAETLLIVLTQWKEICCEKKSMLLFGRITDTIANISHQYKDISPKTAAAVLSFVAKYLEYCNIKIYASAEEDIVKGAEAFCEILRCEVDYLGIKKEEYKRLALVACFAKSWIVFMKKYPSKKWRELLRRCRVINMVIMVTEKIILTKQHLQQCELLLDLLACLASTHRDIFEKVDLFPLQCSVWEHLLPPSKYLHPTFTTREHSVFESCLWNPIYCAGLRLVTELAKSDKMYIKTIAYDFILVHEECLSEIFHIADYSLKEYDVMMILSACSLLKNAFKRPGRWPYIYIKAMQNIMPHVGHCLETVGSLINIPSSLASRIVRYERNLNDPVQLPSHEICDRAQGLQNRLLSLHIGCITVLKCMCPNYSDIVSAEPLGIDLDTICPIFVPTTTVEELNTLVGSVSLFTRSLAKAQNLKYSPTTQIQSPPIDEYSLLYRLPGCLESDIHLALELTLHYLISSVLTVIYFNRVSSRQQILFIRDLPSELSIFIEYVRRSDMYGFMDSTCTIHEREDPLTYSVESSDSESDISDRSDRSRSSLDSEAMDTFILELFTYTDKDGKVYTFSKAEEDSSDEASDDGIENKDVLVRHRTDPQFLIAAAELLKQIFNIVDKPQQ